MLSLNVSSGGLTCPSSTRQMQLAAGVQRLAQRRLSRKCAAPSIRTRSVQVSEPHVVQYEDVWQEFAQRVSGEWEGATASFAADGKAQQLPEYYVPQAYRDWGVELFDWQSQCSSRADGMEFQSVVRRMMPTVGCEADACAFTEEQRQGQGSTASQLAILPDGSYSEGPMQLEEGAEKVALEHCLVLPGGKQRIKVVHTLLRHWKTKQWALENVHLHKEVYDGPWTGRQELAGCGGGQLAFASQPRVPAEQLSGSWSSSGGLCYTVDASTGQLTARSNLPQRLSTVDHDAKPLLLLPLGVWSIVGVDEGAVYAEAGVLLEGGAERMVAARKYSADGQLQQVLVGTERRS